MLAGGRGRVRSCAWCGPSGPSSNLIPTPSPSSDPNFNLTLALVLTLSNPNPYQVRSELEAQSTHDKASVELSAKQARYLVIAPDIVSELSAKQAEVAHLHPRLSLQLALTLTPTLTKLPLTLTRAGRGPCRGESPHAAARSCGQGRRDAGA